MRLIGFTLLSIAFSVVLTSSAPAVTATQKKHPRGYVPAPPAVRAALHAAAYARHDSKMAKLPKTTSPSFDCYTTFGNVLPTDDQGPCGDCFLVSALDGCSMALIKAGVLPNDTVKGRLSSQYGLDYHPEWGGCNGGDEAQVIDYVKTNGVPLTSDYGPYTASPGNRKNTTGMQFYKIKDWGYCKGDQGQGIATPDEIKNAMVQYGPISVAGDAGNFDSYSGGTITGNGTNVDHAILFEGWDDTHDNGDGSKGAFIARNQWGKAAPGTVSFNSSPWGITINSVSGRAWIKYGADSWGTEAIWIDGSGVPPPPVFTITANPSTGVIPLTVNFTVSNAPAASTTVNFGDGSTPVVLNGTTTTSYVYQATGTFQVTATSGTATTGATVTATTVPPPQTYDWNGSTCVLNQNGTGQYPSLAACQAAHQPPPPPPCQKHFHLFGRPHFRCDGQTAMPRQFVFPALHPFRGNRGCR